MSEPVHAAAGHATGAIKKVPKWAWVASGGVILGVVVMRRRGAGATVVSATAPGDTTGQDSFPVSGTVAGPGISGDAGGYSQSAPVDLPGLIDSIGGIFTQAHANDPTFEQIGQHDIDLINTAGDAFGRLPASGPPNSVPSQPNPLPMPEPVAPAPAPAAPPPSSGPVAVSQSPQCGGAYPNPSARGCYKVVIASGKGDHKAGRWHYYADGTEVYVGA